jgi:hypothetical protein
MNISSLKKQNSYLALCVVVLLIMGSIYTSTVLDKRTIDLKEKFFPVQNFLNLTVITTGSYTLDVKDQFLRPWNISLKEESISALKKALDDLLVVERANVVEKDIESALASSPFWMEFTWKNGKVEKWSWLQPSLLTGFFWLRQKSDAQVRYLLLESDADFEGFYRDEREGKLRSFDSFNAYVTHWFYPLLRRGLLQWQLGALGSVSLYAGSSLNFTLTSAGLSPQAPQEMGEDKQRAQDYLKSWEQWAPTELELVGNNDALKINKKEAVWKFQFDSTNHDKNVVWYLFLTSVDSGYLWSESVPFRLPVKSEFISKFIVLRDYFYKSYLESFADLNGELEFDQKKWNGHSLPQAFTWLFDLFGPNNKSGPIRVQQNGQIYAEAVRFKWKGQEYAIQWKAYQLQILTPAKLLLTYIQKPNDQDHYIHFFRPK